MDEMSLNLDTLPFDIQLNIFENFDYTDLNNLSQVNRRLNSVANDNKFWKNKLLKDIRKWKRISSRTYPQYLNTFKHSEELDLELNYKEIYYKSCPEFITQQEILKKLDNFQSTTNSTDFGAQSATHNLTLSTLPTTVLGQIKDFIIKNMSENSILRRFSGNNSFRSLPKIIMFGPGLETTTSCLVTNILWKSEFQACGMIPGKDGFGSGIKLKLGDHQPFNLTILYSNNSKDRESNFDHDISANHLFLSRWNETDKIHEYEVQPQVKETCLDAIAFVYVIDNEHIANLDNLTGENKSKLVENYKQELDAFMSQVNASYPLLILSCNSRSDDSSKKSCSEIVEILELEKFERQWLVIDCHVLQHQMKDIVMGFEWVLNEIEQTGDFKKYSL